MPENPMFPFIDTPNSAIDIVQFLLDLRRDAHKFRDWVKTIIEHHQVSKTSFSGTAVEMARILNINPNDRVVVQNWRSHKQQNLHMHWTIISVRDWEWSQEEYQIPDEYRTWYGIHRILFHHPERNITLEQWTQIFWRRAYAEGVNQILCGIEQNIDKIPFGVTNIVDFVQHWYHKWSSSGEHIS
jgi:dihydrodipicolinate reductase